MVMHCTLLHLAACLRPEQHAARTFVRRAPVLRLVATPPKERRWEHLRSGEVNTSSLEMPGMVAPEPRYATLHRREYWLLRQIQRIPGLMPISLAVHYSLLPKVITPLLALIVWLASLPVGASLITFVCAQDCLNTAVKWAIQRPRPRWYSADASEGLVSRCGAWEVDASFPSAHTQFFSGMAFCTCTLCGWPIAAAACVGALIGLTRNYLSMHWPTDTLAGLVFGGVTGVAWGAFDPYSRLLRARSPLLSLATATSLTVGLLCLMLAARQAVRPVSAEERALWFTNALQSLPPSEREQVLTDPRRRLRPRNLKSKVPMLVTVWCTLAITAVYPLALPAAAAHPLGDPPRRLLQTLIGLVGLGGVGSLKKTVGRVSHWSDRQKGTLKALTYAALCAWTFVLSQLAANALLG